MTKSAKVEKYGVWGNMAVSVLCSCWVNIGTREREIARQQNLSLTISDDGLTIVIADKSEDFVVGSLLLMISYLSRLSIVLLYRRAHRSAPRIVTHAVFFFRSLDPRRLKSHGGEVRALWVRSHPDI